MLPPSALCDMLIFLFRHPKSRMYAQSVKRRNQKAKTVRMCSHRMGKTKMPASPSINRNDGKFLSTSTSNLHLTSHLDVGRNFYFYSTSKQCPALPIASFLTRPQLFLFLEWNFHFLALQMLMSVVAMGTLRCASLRK